MVGHGQCGGTVIRPKCRESGIRYSYTLSRDVTNTPREAGVVKVRPHRTWIVALQPAGSREIVQRLRSDLRCDARCAKATKVVFALGLAHLYARPQVD